MRLDFGARAAARPPPEPPAAPVAVAPCPKCRTGTIVVGRTAWGCSRWREGCHLVVPFACGGRRITPAQLRDLLARGVTRRSKSGRLRLDLAADPPAVQREA